MKTFLLGAAGLMAVAALGVVPASAQAGDFHGSSRSGDFVGRPAGSFATSNGLRSDCFGNRCRRNRASQTDVVMDWYGGEWALYNNRSWAPNSYNDWWHERPDRAYPEWMRNNQGCARMWYAGDTLRC